MVRKMLRITDRTSASCCTGRPNEEMITEIFRSYVNHTKACRSISIISSGNSATSSVRGFGVMRGREFLMKDAYSSTSTRPRRGRSYNKMFVAYLRTFARMGLKAIPMRAETGPIGAISAPNSSCSAETGESAVLLRQRTVLNLPVPGDELDYEVRFVSPIIKQWTSVYAATEDVHRLRTFSKTSEVPIGGSARIGNRLQIHPQQKSADRRRNILL